MGSYLCIASNGVPPSVSKRISLSIHFHPVIQVPNQLVGAPLGTDVTIECQVEASPKSINYWVKDTEMIVSSPKYHVQDVTKSLYETKMSMTVRSFQKEDVGSYRCIAKNSLGEVDSSIRLYEIPGPSRKVYAPKFDQNEIAKDGANKQLQQQGKTKVSAYPPDDDEQQYGSAEDLDDLLDASLGTHLHHQHHNPHSHQHQHHQLAAGGFKLAAGGGGTARSPYDHPNSINGLGPNGNKHLPAIDLVTRKPFAMPPVRNGPDGSDGSGGPSYGHSRVAVASPTVHLLALASLVATLLATGGRLLH
uniref:Ig-like domain-containing protein n=1 Tax=Anopheles atroparvus TaxID=41427 RepID=A0AAG5DW14_ANOAO